MKKSMDLFGEALLAYLHGDKSTFYFEDPKGNRWPPPLKKYFRRYKQFNKLERKIISLAHGNILDVGCGTGNYIPYLMKRGKVLGIDISPSVIKVARETGLKNVKVAGIFNFRTKERFDTIVFLENNLGMVGTVPKSKDLMKILSGLLKRNGCILTNTRPTPGRDFFKGTLYPVWKGKKGPKFEWINFSPKFLVKLCSTAGLKLEIVDRDRHHYLAKITKE